MSDAMEWAVLGDVPGADRTLDEMERLLWTLWPVKERNLEPGLMVKKWWDYRVLHPVQATYLFAGILTNQVRDFIRSHINDAPARITENGKVVDWHMIKSGDVFEPPAHASRHAYWKRKVDGLIRARQAADAEGIDYSTFISVGLRHFYQGAGSYVLAKRNAIMPEPNLLYGEAVLAEILGWWAQMIMTRVQHAHHPRYLLPNDDGHPDIATHRDWLIQQLCLRSAPELAAANLVRRDLLSVDDACKGVRNPDRLRQLLSKPN